MVPSPYMVSPNPAELYFRGVSYNHYAPFADLNPFLATFQSAFAGLPASSAGLRELLNRVSALPAGKTADQYAIGVFAAEFIGKQLTWLEAEGNIDFIEREMDIERCLADTQLWLRYHFESINVDVPDFVVRIGDEFPHPFTDNPSVAISFDENDYRNYGIDPGVYFKRSSTRPILSRMLLCHEVIHVLLTRFGATDFGGMFEEGVAELYGAIYLFSKLMGKSLTETAFMYHRLSGAPNKLQEAYADYGRMALLYLNDEGVEAIEGLLRDGRTASKRAELKLWTREADMRHTQSSNTAALAALASRFYLLYGRTLTVSPFAKFLSSYANTGETVISLSKMLGLPEAWISDGLIELSKTPRIIELKNDAIIYSEAPRLIHPAQLRFVIPAGTLPLGTG